MKTIDFTILDFIEIDRFKNGRVKIKFSQDKEYLIYKALKQLGYCYTRIDNKRGIYYKREIDNISLIHNMRELRDAFHYYFQQLDHSCLPVDISFIDVMNQLYQQRPLKLNNLLRHYLRDELSGSEIEILTKN